MPSQRLQGPSRVKSQLSGSAPSYLRELRLMSALPGQCGEQQAAAHCVLIPSPSPSLIQFRAGSIYWALPQPPHYCVDVTLRLSGRRCHSGHKGGRSCVLLLRNLCGYKELKEKETISMCIFSKQMSPFFFAMTEFAMLYEKGEKIHELQGFPVLAWFWLTSSSKVGCTAVCSPTGLSGGVGLAAAGTVGW